MFAYLLLAFVGIFAIGGGAASASTSTTAKNNKKPVKDKKNEEEDNQGSNQGGNDPVIVDPVIDDPTPVVDDPVVDDPVVDDPVVDDPVVDDPVVDDPVVDDPVVDDPVVDDPANPNPTPPVQNTDSNDGGSVSHTELSNGITVAGGRVTTLEIEDADTISSVRVTELPNHGNLTVNPDNTLALVMSGDVDYSGNISFGYEVTYQDGSTQTFENSVHVAESTQGSGWGAGNYYMLETDENGDVVVEHGENHRDVFVSGSDDALSLSDIAALEGLSTNQITTDWLQDHPEYGGSEDMALDSEAGIRLWDSITGPDEQTSHWLLFERGYEYDDLGSDFYPHIFSMGGATGEDPLHPNHITAYGTGIQPILDTSIMMGSRTDGLVFSEVTITGGFAALGGSNILLDDVNITNDIVTSDNLMGLVVQDVDGFSLHNSSIADVYRTEHPDGADYWGGGGYMASGAYIATTDRVLIEDSLFDHNGWAPDYQPDTSTDGGQAPTMFNHNFYIDWNNTDVTFRDNITMQAASNGAQIRSGGLIEDNVFLDNNAAGNFQGGDYFGTGSVGNFSLFADNVITSGAHRTTDAENVGALTMGITNGGEDSTLIDNIIAHLSDPNNPTELEYKTVTHFPLANNQDPFYDDTSIFNWRGSDPDWWVDANSDQNVDGLDTSVLNATTIQIFTQELLGDPNAGIPELAEFLRAQADGSLDDYVDADLIIDFFQTGFGLSVEGRITPEEIRFIPNDLGDGIRWDNRLNWTTDDLPGSINGDSVDLGGNWVNYGGTTTIDNMDFGSGGMLTVSHGRLDIEGTTSAGENGAELDISSAGQVWVNGYNDPDQLEVNVDGGRFVNTGHVDGNTELNITDGQTVLATDGAAYDVANGSEINIDGSDAKVGFDGEDGDTAVLRLEEGGNLNFTADEDGFSTIEEFRTGAMGEDTDVASGVNLGLASIEIDVTELGGETGTFDLIAVDEIIGELSDITLTGLAGNQDAHLMIDYATDKVTLQLSNGDGNITLDTEGTETDMDSDDASDLLAALTAGQGIYSDNRPTELYDEDELVGEMAA